MKKQNDMQPEEIPHIEIYLPEGVDPQTLPSLDEVQNTPAYKRVVRAIAAIRIDIASRRQQQVEQESVQKEEEEDA